MQTSLQRWCCRKKVLAWLLLQCNVAQHGWLPIQAVLKCLGMRALCCHEQQS